jgi:hypothetical protein
MTNPPALPHITPALAIRSSAEAGRGHPAQARHSKLYYVPQRRQTLLMELAARSALEEEGSTAWAATSIPADLDRGS